MVSGDFAHRCMNSGSGPFGGTRSELCGSGFCFGAGNCESGPEMQTWARSGGMQRLESQKVVELPMFCAVDALKLFVLYCSGGLAGQSVLESSIFLEVEAARLFVL